MSAMLLAFLSLACLIASASCQVYIDPPKSLQECVTSITLKTGNLSSDVIAMTSPEEIHTYCMQQFLWAPDKVNWPEFNITREQMDMVNVHLRSLIQHGRRSKRQARAVMFPPSGFRIRREYRRLLPFERFAFHQALNQMKLAGEYDAFSNLHTGIAVSSAHNGPNFFGWHRVYLAVMEEALRRYSPFIPIAMPYWDSSMDFDMVDPVNSVMWSSILLGNGNGEVTTGPFGSWNTPPPPPLKIMRNIGGGSVLISKEVIMAILSRCWNVEISVPTALPQFNLEFAHNGVHVWVGGHMSGSLTAPQDPVFFLHHAFIDYIWELFRIRQAFVCGVNPETDYPATGNMLHAPDRPMDFLPPHRNIDGLSNMWTMFWYRYERSPSCSFFMPFCGSPFLWCDVARGRCISRERTWFGGAGGAASGYAGAADSSMSARARSSMLEDSFDFGPRFVGPPSDGRTTDVRLGRARRFKRAAPTSAHYNAYNRSQEAAFHQLGPMLNGNNANARYRAQTGMRTNQFNPTVSPWETRGAYAANFPLLPTISFSVAHSTNSQHQKASQNDEIKVFIPVKVFYVRAPKDADNAINSLRNSMHSPNMSARASPYDECKPHPSGETKMTIQSSGINYMGVFSQSIKVDTRVPRSTITAYVRINPPKGSHAELVLSAFHECGLMCQPICAKEEVDRMRYTTCTGIVKIGVADKTVIRGASIEAALRGKTHDGLMAESLGQEPKMSFQCSDTDVSSWSQRAYSPIWDTSRDTPRF